VPDAQHRVVITQGINEVAKSAPYAPDAVGFGEDDAAFLEAQGFTSVRLGVLWAGVEPRPGASAGAEASAGGSAWGLAAGLLESIVALLRRVSWSKS